MNIILILTENLLLPQIIILSEMGVRTAAGGPSIPHRHAVAPAAPARAAKPPRSRSAYGVAAVISAVGEGVRCMARPPAHAA